MNNVDNKGKRLLKKFLSFSIGSWVTLIISLISTPIVTRILSPEDYGTLNLFLIVISLFSLISILGIDQSFIRFYYDSSDKSQRGIFFIGIVVATIIYISFLFIFIVTKSWSWKLILGTNDLFIFILFCIVLFTSILNRYNYVILRMEQRAKFYSTLQVIQKLIDFLIFIIIIILFKFENVLLIAIISYAVATCAVFCIGVIGNREIIYKTFIKRDFDFKGFSPSGLIKYGLPLSITVLITWVFQYIDRLMLNHFTDLFEVGIYTAAFKLIAIISIIQTTFTTFWVPVSYQEFSKNNGNNVFFEKMFNKILYIFLCIGITLIFIKDYLVIFFGEHFRIAVDLVPVLLLVPIMYTLSEITVVGINFMQKPKYHIYISITVCLLNVIGNILLIPIYGAMGAAFSTGITYILFFLIRSYIGLKLFYFKVFTLKNILLLTAFFIICFYSIFF